MHSNTHVHNRAPQWSEAFTKQLVALTLAAAVSLFFSVRIVLKQREALARVSSKSSSFVGRGSLSGITPAQQLVGPSTFRGRSIIICFLVGKNAGAQHQAYWDKVSAALSPRRDIGLLALCAEEDCANLDNQQWERPNLTVLAYAEPIEAREIARAQHLGFELVMRGRDIVDRLPAPQINESPEDFAERAQRFVDNMPLPRSLRSPSATPDGARSSQQATR